MLPMIYLGGCGVSPACFWGMSRVCLYILSIASHATCIAVVISILGSPQVYFNSVYVGTLTSRAVGGKRAATWLCSSVVY